MVEDNYSSSYSGDGRLHIEHLNSNKVTFRLVKESINYLRLKNLNKSD